MDIELEWLQATLNDASEALQDALQKVENGDQEDALEVLNHDLVHVYAKLNYAVNTARLGPAALDAMSADELIGWPARMPFQRRPPAGPGPGERRSQAITCFPQYPSNRSIQGGIRPAGGAKAARMPSKIG